MICPICEKEYESQYGALTCANRDCALERKRRKRCELEGRELKPRRTECKTCWKPLAGAHFNGDYCGEPCRIIGIRKRKREHAARKRAGLVSPATDRSPAVSHKAADRYEGRLTRLAADDKKKKTHPCHWINGNLTFLPPEVATWNSPEMDPMTNRMGPGEYQNMKKPRVIEHRRAA